MPTRTTDESFPKIETCCPYCKGTGKTEVTGVYKATLRALSRRKREVSGAELGRALHVNGAAMANRLVRLEELGFAKRRRNGRECLWTAISQEPS